MTDFALPIVRTVAALRGHIRPWRERGQTVALVPTLGALHDGHLSLVRMARQQADRVVVSVFVNPRQFGPAEDFEAYPRDEAGDARQLASAASDLMYAPAVTEMYPAGFSTSISVRGVSEILDGLARPGHFDGVATVVAKLFTQVDPDVAIFGEKDYQQLQLIRRMARDLDLRVSVLGAPTVRAADGLALSSRNAYLTAQERAIAPRLHAILKETAATLARGEPVAAVESRAVTALAAAGFAEVDYLETRSADDLVRQGPGPVKGAARVLVAARLGKARLIDNVAV